MNAVVTADVGVGAGYAAALEAFADGEIVLVGDPGDPVVFLAAAADRIDGPRLERLQELSGGRTLLGLGEDLAAALGLEAQRQDGGLGLDLTAPIDAAHGIRGGWSADDRAHTIRIAADPATRPADLIGHGHVHGARLHPSSTPAAAAALELVRELGAAPAVVLGAIADDRGQPAPLSAARDVPALAALPRASSTEVRAGALLRRAGGRVLECTLPTADGPFRAVALDDPAAAGMDGSAAGSVVALVHGDLTATSEPRSGPLVHVHPACLLGDAFGSLLCDCRAELDAAAAAIVAAGGGVIVYVKPGTGDPRRRYHCGAETEVDLAPVLALLHACGIRADPSAAATPTPASALAPPATRSGRWLPTSVLGVS